MGERAVGAAEVRTDSASASVRAGFWLESRRRWLLPIFIVACLMSSWVQSHAKPLWFDELFTYYIAGEHGVADVWRTLMVGFEPHPPLFDLLGHLNMALFGASGDALRLPSMAAFCVTELSLFFIVTKAYGELMAWLAVFLTFATAGWEYSFEARPYMLVLTGAALAFLGWQRIEERRSFIWSALLACGTAITVLSHFYGVIAVVPICVGEAVYLWQHRRFRTRVWLAFGAGYLAILALIPFILSLRSNFGGGTFNPRIYWYWADFALAYEELFHDLLYPLLIAVLIGGVALALGYRIRRPSEGESQPRGFSHAELVAAAGLALAPITVQILTHIVVGYYYPRYAITSILGVCLLIPALLSCSARSTTGVVSVLIVSCALVFGWNDARALKRLRNPPVFEAPVTLAEPEIPKDLPIAVQDPLLHLRLMKYAPDDLKSRLYFPASSDLSTKYLRNPINDRGMIGLSALAPIHVVPFEEFTAAHRRFILYVGPDDGQSATSGWLTTALLGMGAELRLVAYRPTASVFEVNLK